MCAQVDALAAVLDVDLTEGGPLLTALRSNDKVTVHTDGSLQYKARSRPYAAPKGTSCQALHPLLTHALDATALALEVLV